MNFDQEGYLKNLAQWDEQLATVIAKKEGIALTTTHWQVIYCLRRFYQNFQKLPSMRVLIKYLRVELNQQQINTPYLLKLFPDGPLKQINKIAGLPKPTHCL